MQNLRNKFFYADYQEEVIDDPPCEIDARVTFVNGVCPISGCESCDECISNDFDAICIWYLRNDPESFGQA